jgi:tripartite-type tricarboxylate transporter receptor subunit TctC
MQASLWLAAACFATTAHAQPYPNRPIRVIVGFGAGGGVDVSARVVGKKLSESFNQAVVVDNRPGASGNAAGGLVAKSPADGYTLYMASSAIAFPSLFPNAPFDVNRDFAPVSLVAMGPSLLVAHPALPVRDIKSFLALAKSRPKQVLYGSAGFGTVTQLAMELLALNAGVELTHVPYKGGGPSIIGLLSGEVHVVFSSVPGVLTQVRANKVRALGMSTIKRSTVLPDVPTLNETVLPGYNTGSWYGLLAPARTPRAVIDLLGGEIGKVMQLPDIRESFVRSGFEPEGTLPDTFAAFIRAEIAKYEVVIRKANIRPETD